MSAWCERWLHLLFFQCDNMMIWMMECLGALRVIFGVQPDECTKMGDIACTQVKWSRQCIELSFNMSSMMKKKRCFIKEGSALIYCLTKLHTDECLMCGWFIVEWITHLWVAGSLNTVQVGIKCAYFSTCLSGVQFDGNSFSMQYEVLYYWMV